VLASVADCRSHLGSPGLRLYFETGCAAESPLATCQPACLSLPNHAAIPNGFFQSRSYAIASIMSIILDTLDTLDTRLGARIRVERENRGWSLPDLAERSGVSRAMINKVERGAASPTASLLGRLSGAFGLTLSMLLARTETDHVGRLVRSDEQFRWV